MVNNNNNKVSALHEIDIQTLQLVYEKLKSIGGVLETATICNKNVSTVRRCLNINDEFFSEEIYEAALKVLEKHVKKQSRKIEKLNTRAAAAVAAVS